MPSPTAPPFPAARIVARGRPAADPGCAGCALLGVFRALRRAGLEVAGRAGCDPGASRALGGAAGRFAALTGAGPALREPGAVLAQAAAAGAHLLVVADRGAGAAPAVAAALARAGARAVTIDPGDLAAAETAARLAAEADPGAARKVALVALSSCRRGARAAAPFAIAPSRCNRCGACLGLGCPAISDVGGEAMAIDAATCTGCGLCAPLCRGRAIVR